MEQNNIRKQQLMNRIALNLIKVLRTFLFYPFLILFLNWAIIKPFDGNQITYTESLVYTLILTAFYNLTVKKKDQY